MVRPYVAGSSSTGVSGSFQWSGSRSAMRWPRTRCTRISFATAICLASIASSRSIGLMSGRHLTASYGMSRSWKISS